MFEEKCSEGEGGCCGVEVVGRGEGGAFEDCGKEKGRGIVGAVVR